MEFETPAQLLARLKLGREEYCQRLLTTLILNAPYPRWNTRSVMGVAGRQFLREVYERSYDSPWPGDDAVFVDEFELPPRHDAEKGGAPDYAVVWPDRLWMIELKTERSSHRPAQIPSYFDLAHHHHPEAPVDLLYVTPPMDAFHNPDPSWGRFAHTTWADLAPTIRGAWPSADQPGQQEVIDGLLEAIANLHLTASTWRETREPSVPVVTASIAAEEPADRDDVLAAALTVAEATASDGRQRAIFVADGSLEAVLAMRLSLRDALATSPKGSPLRHVVPWIWRAESTGRALTPAGEEFGMELRVSRYARPQYGKGAP